MDQRNKRIRLDGHCVACDEYVLKANKITNLEELDTPSSCQFCDEPDTMEMVQCDKCDGWSHFHCAGVDENIKEVEWICQHCEIEMATSRHAMCKKSEPVIRNNYLRSSKTTEKDSKMQMEEFSKSLENLKIEICSKNNTIEQQTAALEAQRMEIEQLSKALSDIKTEMGTKNIEIGRQTAVLEIHRGEIQKISNVLTDLKTEIGDKNDVIIHQDGTLETEIQLISTNLSNLKFENETKNGEIAKQAAELKIHRDEIQRLSNCLANLKTEIGVKSDAENLSKTLVNENAKTDEDDSLELYLNLMCDDESEMSQLQERLAKAKTFMALKTNFCVFGSDCDLKSFIGGMIDRIMSKDLQKKFSWSGKRTDRQGAFTKYTRINDLVHFCCKANFGKYKVGEGEQIIQKIFQSA